MKISLRETCHKGSREIIRLSPWCLGVNFKSRAPFAEVQRVKDPELCPPSRSQPDVSRADILKMCHSLLFLLQVSHGFMTVKFISGC